jgi:preprotein translocase subunit SecD
MPARIRNRLLLIGTLVIACAVALWPRNVTIRTRGADGRMRDTVIERVPLKLGLDLQGGIHLALEVDESKGTVADRSGALDRALRVIRTRIDEFGVAEPLVQQVGEERIVVELPGLRDPARAKEIVQRTAFLEFRIVDMQQQFRAALPDLDAALRRAGVTAGGAAAPSGVEQLLGGDTAAPGRPDSLPVGAVGPLSPMLQLGDQPGEFLVREQDYPRVDSLLHHPEVLRATPRNLEVLWSVETLSQGAQSYRPFYVVADRPILTGEYLADAQAQIDQLYNQAVVNFQLTRQGGRIFSRETGRHVQDYMAIVLDGRVQGDPPVIRSQIGQRGQIELGSASLQQAQDLALVLRAGALPVPLVIVEERTVGPSLGQDAIDKSIRAGVIGTTLVVLIYAIYYRMAGLLAIGALGFYVMFTLGGLAAFGATLTVPGLAGFILSVGMAIDGNVLIYERIREELGHGKTIRAAVDTGFTEAWRAIIDSHATTLITALFLFRFGTGPVKGFAVTLTIGIIASLFTAVSVSRTFFLIWLHRRPDLKELSI